MKDFFISFNSADKEWAEWIAWTLEEVGYSVVYQNWDFRPGEYFVLKMHEATIQTKHTIIVLSQNYLNALFTQPEWASGFAKDPLGAERTLIPFKIDQCSPPGLLSTLIYADLTNLTEEATKLEIVKALKRNGRPELSPNFPGGETNKQINDSSAQLIAKSFPGNTQNKPINPNSESFKQNSVKIADKSESEELYPPLFLEKRIRSGYQFILDCQRSSQYPRNLKDGVNSNNLLIKRYKEVIILYIEIYFSLCKLLKISPRAQIFDIADTLGCIYIKEDLKSFTDKKFSDVYTTIPGSQIVKVVVTQIFRIADLLTRPESVKARKLYESITKPEILRRTLNRNNENIKLGNLGNLKLVTSKTAEYDRFWRSGVPDLRLATTQPLTFIPYELSLTNQLQNLRSEFGSILESALLTSSESIKNSQISGHLRIYPPGTGVISLGITLEFKEATHIELIAQIAHNIEELLFVDVEGLEKPYHKLMLEIVDEVINEIFKKDGIPYDERRWLPPTTTYTFRDDNGLSPEEKIEELAYLMSLAPGNKENIQYLKDRIKRVLKTTHWKRDGVLATPGQDVALLFIKNLNTPGDKNRRKNFLNWLSETHEMVSAAAYAQQAFAEEINKIYSQQLLDETWLPENGSNFDYLYSLLLTMKQVIQAIASIKVHLNKQGAGFLVEFANDVWTYSCPVDNRNLRKGLNYIADWLQNAPQDGNESLVKLEQIIKSIKAIQLPFYIKTKRMEIDSESTIQDELETRLLNELQEIEQILKKNGSHGFNKSENHIQTIINLRRQLGF